MLKSLEKLREHTFIGNKSICDLADEIQAEIDRFYLPRPLFEDGEPAEIGDQFEHSGGIDAFLFLEDGTREVWSRGERFVLQPGECLSRPPEPDTQEKIDEDSELTAREYCDKHGIDASYGSDYVRDDYPEILMRRHLLERQRKLDGVE